MNKPQFDQLVTMQFAKCRDMLGLKGTSYSGGADVLANFKRNAERLGLTPYQVWAVYFNKHIDAIQNAVKSTPDYPLDKSEGMEGRITDAIDYLLLLSALLEDSQLPKAKVFDESLAGKVIRVEPDPSIRD